MKDVGGAVLAGSSPPFLGRERAAVDVDVGPERRSPRYHETCLALESVKESSAAGRKPRCVWLRVFFCERKVMREGYYRFIFFKDLDSVFCNDVHFFFHPPK